MVSNLNDLGKVRPDLLIRTSNAWLEDATPERRALIDHALRSAVKPGDADALALLGYLTTRLPEFRAELQRNEAELGTPINNKTAQEIVAEVISVLRDAGTAELAVRYQAAIEGAMSAIAHHKELIEQDADESSVNVARELRDDAIEELQRVD